MNYPKALLFIAISTLATFVGVNAMEIRKNPRRVVDFEARAEANYKKNDDFLGNVSNSSGLEDSLGMKSTAKNNKNNITLEQFQTLQQKKQFQALQQKKQKRQ